MPRRAILYIDLLGVQKMWQSGGSAAVKLRIAEFNSFILEQLNFLTSALHRDGDYTVILSGDSVAVTCEDFDQAIGIGIHLFTQAFYSTDRTTTPFWLRGAIGRWSNQYLTVNTVPISTKGVQVGTQYQTEDDFLAVLALEKSGFKGMRLIIDTSLLPNHGHDCTRVWTDFLRPLGIVARLEACTYPGLHYSDILWMANDEARYRHLSAIMAQRFKASSRDPDEFTQAAWTRVTFDQLDTLVWVCRNRPLLVDVTVPASEMAEEKTVQVEPQVGAPDTPVGGA